MIWVSNRIVAESDLTISCADRTFEHGLGLFETLRTWNGSATLLSRHLARMTRSAHELGLALDPTALPDSGAVAQLLRSDRVAGDAMLRITLTGGLSPTSGSVAWMRSAPLPGPSRAGGAIVCGFWTVASDDPLARHKSLNYWRRRLAFEEAQQRGFDESLGITIDGRVWEGSRSNLFCIVGQTLLSPPREGPIVPGIMRALVLERAGRLGLEVLERTLTPDQLRKADEVFLSNAVRGILPVKRLDLLRGTDDGSTLTRLLEMSSAPGPWTARLWNDLAHWLEGGGCTP